MSKKKNTLHNNHYPGRIRIVSGIWRNRFLKVANLENLRPTSERIRETLFNWLAPDIENAQCLDLFAGTGSLGFEALSRGASSVTFVENSKLANSYLHETAKLFGAINLNIYNQEAMVFLKSKVNQTFNLIGWQTKDIYQNVNVTLLYSIQLNQQIDKDLFKLPTQN